MKKKPFAFIALAFIFLSLALIRLPEGIRAVDVVSLLATGVVIGALLTTGISKYRADS